MKTNSTTKIIYFVLGIVIGGIVTVSIINAFSFSGGSPDFKTKKVTNISPSEVSAMINAYHDQSFNKLKVLTEGGTEDLHTFIVQDSIFMKLKELTETRHPDERFEGIGLTLGLNEFGATAIVSALINGKDSDSDYLFLIPDSNLPEEQQRRYFYDHLDICPVVCPKNKDELSRM